MGKVDILLEILKPPTAATAVSMEEMPSLLPEWLPEPHFTDDMSFDTEFRDPPPSQQMNFDFYGNPIERQANRVRFNEVELFEAALERSQRKKSDIEELNPYEQGCMHEFGEYVQSFFRLHGNSSAHETKNSGRRKTSEELNPYEQGCLHEFGEYIQSLFGKTFKLFERRRNYEIGALQKAVSDASQRNSSMEVELRCQLLEIRQQKQDMEHAFRQEISQQFCDKVLLQAQLQAKLLSIVEQRVSMEIELARLNLSGNYDGIPTVAGTPIHEHTENAFEFVRGELSPHSSVSFSPLDYSKPEISVKSTTPLAKATKTGLSVNLGAPALGSKPELPFSPTHHFSPSNAKANKAPFFNDAESATVSKPTTSKKSKKKKKGPGLSIVTENSAELSFHSEERLPTATPVLCLERGMIEVSE